MNQSEPDGTDRLPGPDRVDDLLTELQRSNAALRLELEIARADADALQNALADVTPLHRHVISVVKARLGGADRRTRAALEPASRFTPADAPAAEGLATIRLLDAARAADRTSVASYAAQPSSSPLARAYLRISRSAYRGLRHILGAVTRRLR